MPTFLTPLSRCGHGATSDHSNTVEAISWDSQESFEKGQNLLTCPSTLVSFPLLPGVGTPPREGQSPSLTLRTP